MKILVDTHVLLWMSAAPERLQKRPRAIVEDVSTDIVVSIVSIWEIAMKHADGKLGLPIAFQRWTTITLQDTRAAVLGIQPQHVFTLAALPPHHRDPFDRMLVAQAIQERLTVLTADRVFKEYAIDVIDA